MDESLRKGMVADLTLMLLNLTSWEGNVAGEVTRRSPIQYDKEILKALARQGMVEVGGKSKTVALTDEGRGQAEMLTALFAAAQEDFFNALEGRIAEREEHPGWFRLRVELDLWGERTCWRELLAPAWFTFGDLHTLIQASFLWWDYHLHDFRLRSHGKDLMLVDPDAQGVDGMFGPYPGKRQVVEETSLYLDDVFPRTRKVQYSYDYGDGWEHAITLVEKLPDAEGLHIGCAAGEGDAPPEDVGSVSGFMSFLEAIGDPSHPEYDRMRAWGYSQFYEPFNLDAVNDRIARWGSPEMLDEWDARHAF